MADFSPLSGAALISEQYVLLARSVIEEMVEHLPNHYEASQGSWMPSSRSSPPSFLELGI
jgi:hypothetical protein